ncbi:MAG: hypothetical protein HY835_04780, partial [Anaerolineae bacterium]|nr:hypothetical protein [Anaerolineae bacterium]
CHSPGSEQVDPQRCIACHAGENQTFMDSHTAVFGANCLQCHDGIDRMQGFKHENVFALTGAHAVLQCETCHVEKKFHGTPSECAACHKDPEIHAGAMGVKCQYCHTTDAWQPALLHTHVFPLDHGGKGEQTCQTCHAVDYAQFDCYSCHDHTQEGIAQSHTKAGIPAEKLPDCAACHLDGLIHRDTGQ